MINRNLRGLLMGIALLAAQPTLHAKVEPFSNLKGLMLNLDFQSATNGLIPNQAFYPLYVPQRQLLIKPLLGKMMLVLTPDRGLEIPHSSLLQPDGSGWVVSVTVGANPGGGDGMVLSQTDAEHGYAIYLKNGAPQAVVSTGNCAMLLKEDPNTEVTDCREQLTTIQLRIKQDSAMLDINHNRVAEIPIDGPLTGHTMPIRIGNLHELPTYLKNIPGGIEPTGFSGAISNLKIWRQ